MCIHRKPIILMTTSSNHAILRVLCIGRCSRNAVKIAYDFQFIALPDTISDTFTHFTIACILFHTKSFHSKDCVQSFKTDAAGFAIKYF